MALNYGSRFLDGHRPDHSAYLVRRLREAGFVIVGVTNLPEFGILPTTEPRLTGADAQPVGPRAHAGRLERRLGGRGRGRDAPARARQRRRRLDPDPGRLLRAGRAQAEPRARLARAGPRATRGWPATACSRAPWPTPRTRSTCSAATRSATRTGRRGRSSPTRPRCGATPGGCGSRSPPRTRTAPTSTPTRSRACGSPPSCWPRSATTWSRRRRRGRRRTCSRSSSTSSGRRSRSGSTPACCAPAASRPTTRSSRSRGCCSSARGRRRRSAT